MLIIMPMRRESIMSRPRIVLAALLLAFLPGVALAQGGELKIAYVDSDAVIKQAPGYTEANEEFNRTANEWRDSLAQRQQGLQELFEEYKRQEVILSPEKKIERQEEMLRLEREMQEYFQSKFGPEGEAGTRQAELMQPIIERVNRVIDQTRQQGQYSLIFDLNDGALVAGDPALNITEEVIQKLRASEPVAPSSD
jgi:outer membrane protein